MNRSDLLAFDYATARSFDDNGHLNVGESNISRACVNPYYGREIPRWREHGLDPSRIYRIFRDPHELQAAAESFNGKPLLLEHRPVSAQDHAHEITIGAVSNVRFDAPFLKARLDIWDAKGIRAIESGAQRQLSAAYAYDFDPTPGIAPDGSRYDGRMTNLRANHVALVEEGRAGPSVVVADSALEEEGIDEMADSDLATAVKFLCDRLDPEAKAELAQLIGKSEAPSVAQDARTGKIAFDRLPGRMQRQFIAERTTKRSFDEEGFKKRFPGAVIPRTL